MIYGSMLNLFSKPLVAHSDLTKVSSIYVQTRNRSAMKITDKKVSRQSKSAKKCWSIHIHNPLWYAE